MHGHDMVKNREHYEAFLGASEKSQKATVNFVMSDHSYVWNNSAPTGQILMKFDI
jgi:hypothetical protein